MEALSARPITYVDDEIIAEGGNEDDNRYGYCYYTLATGWIVQGRADPASIETYRKKGCNPLVEEYGRFVMNPSIIRDRKGNSLPQWQPYFQPYDKLLLEDPGRFPVEQVVAYHWHRGVTAQWVEYLSDGRYKTHRRKVTFPQLVGRTFPDHLCVICGRMLNTPAELNTHTRMSHPEQGTILKLAETQQAIATAITTAQSGSVDGALLQSIVETQARMTEVLTALITNQQQAPQPGSARPRPSRATVGKHREKDGTGRFTKGATDDGHSTSPRPQLGGSTDGDGGEADVRDPEGAVAPA